MKGTRRELHGSELTLDFNKLEKAVRQSKGILPVAVQHADTREVILVAYTNELAFRRTIETRSAVLLEHLPQRVVGEGQDLRRDLRPGGNPRELRAELAALRGAPPPRRHLPHQEPAGQPRNCYYRRLNLETA
jgi:hypothetical protein